MTRAPAGTDPVRLHKALDRIWRTGRGPARLSAVNHSVLGLRFIVTACVFFAIGGVLAMLIRAQLSTPHSAFVGPDAYNQIFTMHGTVMMFLFAIPLIEGFAIYFLPKLLGARDLAFPRLTAFGYWCYLFGGTLIVVAMLFGVAPDSGWFMYTPLSSKPYSPGINADVWLLGVTFVEISAVCAAVEIIVSILKVRAPGMSLDKLPLFAWYMLVTAFMMLFGFPPLILGSILLELERAFGLPFFDPVRGGHPLLWQHLFWLFGHPEVYIIFLPAAGMISTILPVFAGRDILGYTWIVVAIVALAFLSFGLWVHHMFAVGIPHLALGFFSAASTLVAVPTAVQIFAWIGTLALGRPRLDVPMLYILGFFAIFVIGGLTGVMVAVVPFDWQVHDSHFVVAHLHYVLVGGFVFPMIAALYFWLPLASGRETLHPLGKGAFWLIFVGFNLTFFVMHWTGLMGMPRRVFTYGADTGWTWLNLVSSFGGFVMAIGFALVAVDLLLQASYGARRHRNPWGAGTLEWAIANPVPAYNFASLPRVEGRSPLTDRPELAPELARGDGYLGSVRHGWLETLGVDMVSGRVQQLVVLPGPTVLPLLTALCAGAFFLGILFQVYAAALAGLAGVAAFALAWAWRIGARWDVGPLPIGRGERASPHWESERPPSFWGMVFTLGADAALFGSLAFGALFLLTMTAAPLPALSHSPDLVLSAIAAGALVVAAAGGADAAGRDRGSVRRTAGATLTLAGQVAAASAFVLLALAVPQPTAHALSATLLALAAYGAIHAAIGALFAGYSLARWTAGQSAGARALDLRIGAPWHLYTAATGLVALALSHLVAGATP